MICSQVCAVQNPEFRGHILASSLSTKEGRALGHGSPECGMEEKRGAGFFPPAYLILEDKISEGSALSDSNKGEALLHTLVLINTKFRTDTL